MFLPLYNTPRPRFYVDIVVPGNNVCIFWMISFMPHATTAQTNHDFCELIFFTPLSIFISSLGVIRLKNYKSDSTFISQKHFEKSLVWVIFLV